MVYNKELDIRGKNNGYFYFIDYDHPLATGNSGRVYLHRHLASLKEGRWIRTDEDVNHINGNRLDNSPDNLEVLSKVEHAKKDALRLGKCLFIDKACDSCGQKFTMRVTDQKYCSPVCSSISQKRFEISKDELQTLVYQLSIVGIAKMFDCSDAAIHKRCKKLGIVKPPRGYRFKRV